MSEFNGCVSRTSLAMLELPLKRQFLLYQLCAEHTVSSQFSVLSLSHITTTTTAIASH